MRNPSVPREKQRPLSYKHHNINILSLYTVNDDIISRIILTDNRAPTIIDIFTHWRISALIGRLMKGL